MSPDFSLPPATDPIRTAPLVVEATRGSHVENRHEVTFALVDRTGRVVMAAGDPERQIFPRSAIKLLQAVPLAIAVNEGLLSASPKELALAASSHNSEPMHVSAVNSWLDRADISHDCLCCGAHQPLRTDVLEAQARAGDVWTKSHNNCSGKHAGFLALAKAKGDRLAGYQKLDHPTQQRIIGTVEHFCGIELDLDGAGIDGCGIPTIPMALGNLALGFAKAAEPEKLSEDRAAAIKMLIAAQQAHPLMVAGTKRLDSLLLPQLPDGSMVKVGAEGVYTAALSDLGLGLALKVHDGRKEIAEFALVRLLARLNQLKTLSEGLASFYDGTLYNWAGEPTGTLRFSTENAMHDAVFPL